MGRRPALPSAHKMQEQRAEGLGFRPQETALPWRGGRARGRQPAFALMPWDAGAAA